MQHEGNGAEDVVAEAEASSDGGGDPPKVGDVCIDECGVAQVFNGDGWEVWKFKVTGTGQISPTDSPLEWLLGAWKTPLQAADDLAVLGFAKFAGGNGKNIFIKGVGEVNAEIFHRTIKPGILSAAGRTSFVKIVGKNPDVFVQNGTIILKGTGSTFSNKIYNTGLNSVDFFGL